MAKKPKKNKAVKAVAKAVRKAILKGVSGDVVEQEVELTIVKIAKAKDPAKQHSKRKVVIASVASTRHQRAAAFRRMSISG